jgi:hypothetical protein
VRVRPTAGAFKCKKTAKCPPASYFPEVQHHLIKPSGDEAVASYIVTSTQELVSVTASLCDHVTGRLRASR